MPSKILKRDGCIETWSTKRIGNAIFKALNSSGIKAPLLADRLAGKVEQELTGVDILNLPKLAYLAHNEEDFIDLVTEYARLASESLEFKRKVV